MRAPTLTLLLATALSCETAHAQNPAGSIPSVAARVETVDRYFDLAVDSTNRFVALNGWGKLASPQGQQDYRLLVEQIDGSLAEFRSKPRLEAVPTTLGERLTRFFVYMDSIYGYPEREVAAPVLEAKDTITVVFVGHLAQLNAEYYRRFFIKYGKTSERLNLLEGMLLNRAFSTVPAGNPERQISRWEPIARLQVVGYEWDSGTKDVRPSPPVIQGGLSYYLFGEGKAQRWINHLGGAVAYQPAWSGGSGWWGFMGHVRNVDIGLLCSSLRCRSSQILTSVNVQVVRNLF